MNIAFGEFIVETRGHEDYGQEKENGKMNKDSKTIFIKNASNRTIATL